MCAVLKGLDDWKNLVTDHPWIIDQQVIHEIAASISGAVEPLTGMAIGPLSADDNLREGLVYSSINSRMRAVMLCIEQTLEVSRDDAKIYATEAVTAFALRLRGIFPKFIGSEYAETEEQRDQLFPIFSEDLQSLSFPHDAFHLVTTNEVLEHVPSIDQAMREIHRVLKPSGWHIGTVPFAYGQNESITKAVLEGGKPIFLMEPEYHGNPVDERGSLVFQIPGWDILDRAKAIGFREAHFKYVLSAPHACLSGDAGGIFVLCLQK